MPVVDLRPVRGAGSLLRSLRLTPGLGEGTEKVPLPNPPVLDGPESYDGPYQNWGLDIAAEKAGTKVYVYDATNFTLVSGSPFRSIRMAAEATHISARTLGRKLDTGKPYKGYYYFSHAQSQGQTP